MRATASRHSSPTVSDWVQRFENCEGIELIEAFFRGKAYARHRHDTYAIGRTLAGVQSFNYRGSKRDSLPGHTIVLHPDEAHDGQAGTEDGFRYRIIYLEPELIQEAIGGKALPFIEGGMSVEPRLARAADALLRQAPNRFDPLELHDAIFELAVALDAVGGKPTRQQSADFISANRAREYLRSNWQNTVTLDEVAAAAERDRWSLSRDFRTLFGTSPHRYLIMRRLDVARALMKAGMALVDVAATTGFADQSHLTRHFKKAFGIAPAHWLRLTTR